MKVGDLKVLHKPGAGFYAVKLCPMNTSNPDPANAFWQQVTKFYRFKKSVLKVLG